MVTDWVVVVDMNELEWSGVDRIELAGHTCCVFASGDLNELLDVFDFGGHSGESGGLIEGLVGEPGVVRRDMDDDVLGTQADSVRCM